MSISRPSREFKVLNDGAKKARPQGVAVEKANQRGELIAYGGKVYSRWHHGKEFKGLYRGQPHYV